MDTRADHPSDMAAVLDWWREAGVDHGFDDAPRQWIVAPAPQDEVAAPVDPNSFPAVKSPRVVAPSAPGALIGGDRARWPVNLSAFAAWWSNEPALDHGQVRGRVSPRGPAAAQLMILVPEPETGDDDMLMSGPQGRLLGAMLGAMGLREDEVYFASALPRHTPMVDWADLAARGLGEVLRMHVTLADPQRLLVFGRHLPPLLALSGLESPPPGNAPTQTSVGLRQFSHDEGDIPLLIARDLGALLERPVAKGHFWQHWLEWTAV